MKQSLIVAALLAVALSACGTHESVTAPQKPKTLQNVVCYSGGKKIYENQNVDAYINSYGLAVIHLNDKDVGIRADCVVSDQ